MTSRNRSHDFAIRPRSFGIVESRDHEASVSPLLQLAGVGKSFGPHRVLDDITFDLRPGEVHVLAGENGAGKSTLVKIIGGIYADFDGAMRVDGRPTRYAGPADAARAGIAVIHQELSLIDSLSVAENLALGREVSTCFIQRDAEYRRVRKACRWLEIPATDADLARAVEDLPLGLQSRVEIAKALMADARVLILDEPTSALNDTEVETLFRVIAMLKQRGVGLLYISHKMDELFRVGDRITVLRDGKRIATVEARDCTPARLVELMIGRPLTRFIPPRTNAVPVSAPLRLEVAGFSVANRDPRKPHVVRELSLRARAGEIVGLAGLEGAGCAEVLRGLFTGERTRGVVRVDGCEFGLRDPSHAIASGVALVTGERKSTGLVLQLGVAANISLATLPRFSTAGMVRLRLESARAARRVGELGIRTRGLDQEVGNLSGGNQQKVVLAKWLESDPRVLLLDEPTRGVDIGAKHEIYALIRQVAERGVAIVLTSTDMVEIVGLCDRVVVLHRGVQAAVLTGGEIAPPRILAAAMGHASP